MAANLLTGFNKRKNPDGTDAADQTIDPAELAAAKNNTGANGVDKAALQNQSDLLDATGNAAASTRAGQYATGAVNGLTGFYSKLADGNVAGAIGAGAKGALNAGAIPVAAVADVSRGLQNATKAAYNELPDAATVKGTASSALNALASGFSGSAPSSAPTAVAGPSQAEIAAGVAAANAAKAKAATPADPTATATQAAAAADPNITPAQSEAAKATAPTVLPTTPANSSPSDRNSLSGFTNNTPVPPGGADAIRQASASQYPNQSVQAAGMQPVPDGFTVDYKPKPGSAANGANPLSANAQAAAINPNAMANFVAPPAGYDAYKSPTDYKSPTISINGKPTMTAKEGADMAMGNGSGPSTMGNPNGTPGGGTFSTIAGSGSSMQPYIQKLSGSMSPSEWNATVAMNNANQKIADRNVNMSHNDMQNQLAIFKAIDDARKTPGEIDYKSAQTTEAKARAEQESLKAKQSTSMAHLQEQANSSDPTIAIPAAQQIQRINSRRQEVATDDQINHAAISLANAFKGTPNELSFAQAHAQVLAEQARNQSQRMGQPVAPPPVPLSEGQVRHAPGQPDMIVKGGKLVPAVFKGDQKTGRWVPA